MLGANNGLRNAGARGFELPTAKLARKGYNMNHIHASSIILAIASAVFFVQGCGGGMHQAILENNLLEVERCLAEENPPVNKKTYGTYPLIAAAQQNHLEMVKRLIQNGADVNAANSGGMTALHLAVRDGHAETAFFLMDKGADIHAVSNAGYTPLYLACTNNRTRMTRYLIAQGADVNKGANDGMTPLHEAAFDGNLIIMDLLLQNGANVNAVTTDNWTPLHYAVDKGHFYAVEMLLGHGADKTIATTKDPQTPLQLAQTKDYTNVIELLDSDGEG